MVQASLLPDDLTAAGIRTMDPAALQRLASIVQIIKAIFDQQD